MRARRRRKKMKTMKFKNIRSLDDLHRHKLRLKRKLRVTENSISEKADVGRLLLGSTGSLGSFFGKKNKNIEGLEYLLPLGVRYINKLLKDKPNRRYYKRLSVYAAIGSIIALFVYQYLGKRKTETEL